MFLRVLGCGQFFLMPESTTLKFQELRPLEIRSKRQIPTVKPVPEIIETLYMIAVDSMCMKDSKEACRESLGFESHSAVFSSAGCWRAPRERFRTSWRAPRERPRSSSIASDRIGAHHRLKNFFGRLKILCEALQLHRLETFLGSHAAPENFN